ncbi:hypothetical protein [Aquisphaera insulae]|uniref:hypothetical protein n=1 Tax=Aquisphaera insulae TaxID=2712864 RepID=UPI0013EDB21F|nr:hypothetical protein [Aquisphaera insulae]
MNALLMVLGALFVPLMAASLFIREWIAIPGFLAITTGGYVASLSLLAWWERRHQTTREVRGGKMAAKRAGDREPRVFPEALGLPFLLFISVVLGGLAFLTLFAAIREGPASKVPASLVIVAPLMLIGFMLWASEVRLIVGMDEVRAVHPWLRMVPDRAFRFGDIDSVETREGGRGGWQVTIRRHDGATIAYRSRDRARVDALLAALADGVARAKPASADLDELI